MIAETPEELDRLLASRDSVPPADATPPTGAARATQKAIALAEVHGVDLASIDKAGFITTEDVEALVARQRAAAPLSVAERKLLAGASTDGVTLPASFGSDDDTGLLDPAFLASLEADPAAFRALPSEEKCRAYREHGALIGDGVVLEDGALLVAPRIVLGPAVNLGRDADVRCDEVVAIGELTHFGPGLELACRRAFIGENVHAGRSIRVGGGGRRDPFATFAVGDLTFIGDEVFVNPCRPVLIGSEVYLTQRAMIVTHNIGHSVLEGFENRFAPVVLEDRSQVGLGTVVYAGCRIGREAIVGSASYVVSDVPAGALALGVPARVAGAAKRKLSRTRQVELAREIVDSLGELLELKGHAVEIGEHAGAYGLRLTTERGPAHVLFLERLDDRFTPPGGEAVLLTLDFRTERAPEGCAVLDLLDRRLHGSGDVLLDSVREHCRKKGIRFAPGPWRYRHGLI